MRQLLRHHLVSRSRSGCHEEYAVDDLVVGVVGVVGKRLIAGQRQAPLHDIFRYCNHGCALLWTECTCEQSPSKGLLTLRFEPAGSTGDPKQDTVGR
jgi:hypothetical protein